MFVKCYFAPLWEAVFSPSIPLLPRPPIKPKVQLDPIYLPAFNYMAESIDQDYWKSIAVRFTQARRHSQGIAEISYLVLQYVRLCQTVGFRKLPFRTHTGCFGIFWKMFTVHIINVVQASSVVIGVLATIPSLILWVLSGGVSEWISSGVGFLASRGISE